MIRVIFFLALGFFTLSGFAQNKSGYTTIFGGGGMLAKFSGDTARPNIGQQYPTFAFPHYPYIFTNGHSNICDSATGKLLMLCNGYIIYDTLGNIMDGGDSLVPEKIYTHNVIPNAPNTQGSLILPKGSNGLYYVFTPTITDSAYDIYVGGSQNKVPFDLLQYHIVDINANGGLGKVIQKNIPLLKNVEMAKVGMMACRHANGYDWWLLKQALDTNMIYTFLVTKDTVLLDTIQGFAEPHFGYYDLLGQSCFSTDGSKYAFASGAINSNGAHLFIADFDRCHGLLSNMKEIYIPHDSSLSPLDTLFGPYFDSAITGLCFSPNDSFLYISRRYTIYQYELYILDSSIAYYLVKQGADTSFIQFSEYGQMQMGIDNRIYIGKVGGTGRQNSVIDKPNLKGGACSFCSQCLRCDTCIDYSSSLSNMPDFNLGKKEPCWPLDTGNLIFSNELLVYPNPSSTIFYIKNKKGKKKELYNSIGQLIIKTTKDEINVSSLSKGVYYLRCDGQVRKVIVE